MRHSKELKDVMRRRRARQDRYGMSSEDYNTVLRKQDYCCALCGKPFSLDAISDIFIDHAHDGTINYRALLCASCNVWVGVYERGGQNLYYGKDRIIRYLESHMPIRPLGKLLRSDLIIRNSLLG